MTYANRRVFVVVPAAGCGSRMQSDRPKQYLPLGRSGQTVLQTTVLALLDVPEIDGIYVAVSPEDDYVETLAIPAAVLRTGGKTASRDGLSNARGAFGHHRRRGPGSCA